MLRAAAFLFLSTLLVAAWLTAGSAGFSAADVRPLVVEDLGPMTFKANVALGPLAPNPAGTGFVQLLFAFPGDVRTTKEPFEIVAVDLQTGAISRTRAAAPGASAGFQVQTWAWGPDGKLYLGTYGPPHLICWDPKTRTARDLGQVWRQVTGAVCVYSLAVGTDGALYGGGANATAAFRYDPGTGQLQEYGVLGLPRTYAPAYAYSIGADERYVYVASGKIPWYLVAYDRQTGKQENLRTYDQRDFPQVIQSVDSVYARVAVAARGGSAAHTELFRLAGGSATPIPSLPPARPRATPVPAAGRPKVFLDPTALPEGDGSVRLWYQRDASVSRPSPTPRDQNGPEQNGWRSVLVPVVVQPFQVHALAVLPDGQVVGATSPYGEMFRFNPTTGQRTILGQPTHINVYSMLVTDGKLYYSGYPSVPLCVYDPARPWTFGADTPVAKAPEADSPRSNPRRLLYYSGLFRVHHGYFLAQDDHGRLYIGCHAERQRVGGALAVYDPPTQQAGGIGEPALTNYDVAGLTSTPDRRLIVYSSRVVQDPTHPDATPTEAKLFVFDPRINRFVRELGPLPGRKSTGVLAAGAPGQVVGASPSSPSGRTTLYAVDVAAGKVLYRRDLSGAVNGSFRLGPDGQIWAFLDNMLIRIRPETGEVAPVINVATGPGDIAFVGRDIYLGGTRSLRRIRRVVPIAQ